MKCNIVAASGGVGVVVSQQSKWGQWWQLHLTRAEPGKKQPWGNWLKSFWHRFLLVYPQITSALICCPAAALGLITGSSIVCVPTMCLTHRPISISREHMMGLSDFTMIILYLTLHNIPADIGMTSACCPPGVYKTIASSLFCMTIYSIHMALKVSFKPCNRSISISPTLNAFHRGTCCWLYFRFEKGFLTLSETLVQPGSGWQLDSEFGRLCCKTRCKES